MEDHAPWRIAIIIMSAVVFVVMIVFNALAGNGGDDLGLFLNSTGQVSDVFYLEITPAGWTFSIWGFIYTWQALWLVYGLSTICRTASDCHIYQLSLMPTVIYVVYIFNNFCNIAWIFLWDRQEINAALALIALIPFTLFICLFFSFRALYKILGDASNLGIKKDIWLVRFLVQNGMAFYAAWVSIATLLNLAMVLTYSGLVDQDIACTVSLSIAAFEILLWFILDNFVFDKYVRYTFSPYITLTVAFAGVVQKNYNLDTAYRNSVFSLCLLILASVLLVVKIILIVVRQFRKPVTGEVGYDTNI